MRRVADRPRWWAVKTRIKEQRSGPHTHTNTYTQSAVFQFYLFKSPHTCSLHTEICRNPMRHTYFIWFWMYISMWLFSFMEKHKCRTTLSKWKQCFTLVWISFFHLFVRMRLISQHKHLPEGREGSEQGNTLCLSCWRGILENTHQRRTCT